jgi:hypothetical protein
LSIPDPASPPPKTSPGTKSSIAYVTITGIQVLTPSTPAYDKVRPVLTSLSTCSPSEGHWTRPPPTIEIVSRSLHGQEPNWQPRRPQSASPVHRASLSPLTGRSPFTSPSSPPSRPASAHPKSTLSDREQALIERLYKPPPRPLPAYASALSIGLKSQVPAVACVDVIFFLSKFPDFFTFRIFEFYFVVLCSDCCRARVAIQSAHRQRSINSFRRRWCWRSTHR